MEWKSQEKVQHSSQTLPCHVEIREVCFENGHSAGKTPLTLEENYEDFYNVVILISFYFCVEKTYEKNGLELQNQT